MELTKEQKVIQKVITEAWSNPSFKKELIANPTDAIKKLTGQTLAIPAGKTLAVYDQSNPNVVCLNIPPQPDTSNMGSYGWWCTC